MTDLCITGEKSCSLRNSPVCCFRLSLITTLRRFFFLIITQSAAKRVQECNSGTKSSQKSSHCFTVYHVVGMPPVGDLCEKEAEIGVTEESERGERA